MWSPIEGVLGYKGMIYPFKRNAEETAFPEHYVCTFKYKIGNKDPIRSPSLPFPLEPSGLFHSAPMDRKSHLEAMEKYFMIPAKRDLSTFMESEDYFHFHFDKYFKLLPIRPWDDYNNIPDGGTAFPVSQVCQTKKLLFKDEKYVEIRDWCVKQAQNRECQQELICVFDKRELLSVDKKKPRLIMPTSTIQYIRDLRMLYWFCFTLSSFAPKHGIYIGKGIFNRDWHYRTKRMQKFRNAFGGDHRRYDGQCFAEALDMCERYYMSCVDCDEQSKSDWRYSRMCNLEFYFMDIYGDVFRSYAKFPTGRFDTACTNSFRNVAILFFLYNKLCKLNHPTWSLYARMQYFDENCVFEVLGDDWNVSVSDELSEWFNPKTVFDVGKGQGFEIDFSFVNVVIPEVLPFCGVWTIEKDGFYLPLSDMLKLVDSFLLRVHTEIDEFDDLRVEFSKLCSLRTLSYTSDEFWPIFDGQCKMYIHHFNYKYGDHPLWLEIRSNYISERDVHNLYYAHECCYKGVALNECSFNSTMTKNVQKKLNKMLAKGHANNSATIQRAKAKAAANARIATLAVAMLNKKGRPNNKINRRKAKKKIKRKMVKSDYFKSLVDPEKWVDVKIPDLNSFPTCTGCLSFDSTLTTTATGTYSAAISPFGMIWPAPNTSGFFGVSNPTGVAPAGLVTLLLNSAKIRPVSCVWKVEYIGNSQTDAGQICSGLIEDINIYSSGAIFYGQLNAFNLFQTIPWNKTVPVRSGVAIRYRPTDPGSLDFMADTNMQNTACNTYYSTVGSGSPTSYPHCFFAVTGATPSTACLRLRCWWNMEYIPANDQFSSLVAAPSPVNMSSLEYALNSFSWTEITKPLIQAGSSILGQMVQQQSQRLFANGMSALEYT